MKNKWAEKEANVCDRTVPNRIGEIGFKYKKTKRNPTLTAEHKKIRVQWTKEKKSWSVGDWRKVIFNDESGIYIGQGGDIGNWSTFCCSMFYGGARGVMVIVVGIGHDDTRVIAFHIALIPLGKVWIQLFSLQIWVNSRTD